MKRLLLALVFVAPFAATNVVIAEDTVAVKDPFTQGDAVAGAAKAAPCIACHGVNGNSSMPDWPKLAGQGSRYIVTQLKAFKSGERKNPIMMGMAAGLSDADMADIAAFMTQQKTAPGLASKDAVAIAEPLFRAGDASRGLPACAACHGPTGAGNPAAGFAHLGGQHAKYTATQLHSYKNGERAVGSNGRMMITIASKLSDQEIEALASYLNGLQ